MSAQETTNELSYLITVSEADISKLAAGLAQAGLRFHPVEDLIAIDSYQDPNEPTVNRGSNAGTLAVSLNEYLEENGMSPKVDINAVREDPPAAAQFLDLSVSHFRWEQWNVSEYVHEFGGATWEEIAQEYPKAFENTAQ